MALFKAYDPMVEINGEMILSFISGLGVFRENALKLLDGHGITNPKSGRWYLQQAWLDAFSDLNENYGRNCLIMIGKRLPQNARFPSDINSVERAMASIDIAYRMNHRNGRIGSYTFTQTGSRQGRMMCDNPYHCEFDQALILTMAEKFKPPGSVVNITHQEGNNCRLSGSDSCVYMINW